MPRTRGGGGGGFEQYRGKRGTAKEIAESLLNRGESSRLHSPKKRMDNQHAKREEYRDDDIDPNAKKKSRGGTDKSIEKRSHYVNSGDRGA